MTHPSCGPRSAAAPTAAVPPAAQPGASPLRRPLAALLALLLLSAPAMARDISGELTYRARIALPPDAEMAIDLSGPTGSVALSRQETAGRQVPLPFSLSVEDTGDLTLRAAIFSGGRAIWLSDPVPVPAGDGPLSLGAIDLAPHQAMGFATRLSCGDRVVDVGFIDDLARLRAEGRSYDLSPRPAASGALYSDGASPETSFWSRGNRALVRLDGTLLPECLPVIPPGLLPFTARGNEPFWSVRVSRDGLQLALPEGKGTTEDHPYSEPEAAGDTLTFATDGFELRLADRLCRDTMTGMPYPYGATLLRGGDDWPGCAGDPATLLHGDWQAVALDGAALPEGIDITLAFGQGRLSGKTACNRVMGGFTLTGEGLTLGPLATTQMACPPEVMEAERATLDALAAVTAFDIDGEGRLLLLGPDGTARLTARR